MYTGSVTRYPLYTIFHLFACPQAVLVINGYCAIARQSTQHSAHFHTRIEPEFELLRIKITDLPDWDQSTRGYLIGYYSSMYDIDQVVERVFGVKNLSHNWYGCPQDVDVEDFVDQILRCMEKTNDSHHSGRGPNRFKF